MLESQSPDPAQAAAMPAPAAPEGADLLIRGKPHDQAFWEQHPEVETYRVIMKAGQANLEDWDVLIWLKPDVATDAARLSHKAEIPERAADATFVVHAAHDLGFFDRHPEVDTWRAAISLNEQGPGAVHTVEVWIKPACPG